MRKKMQRAIVFALISFAIVYLITFSLGDSPEQIAFYSTLLSMLAALVGYFDIIEVDI